MSPLTIREVVRRGRRDLEELDRLRAEVDFLRTRAETAEYLLQVTPDDTAPAEAARPETNGHAVNGHAVNGHAVNGHTANGHPARADAGGATGWASAAVLPRSRPA